MNGVSNGKFKRTSPSDPGSRFGGVAGQVELSVSRSIDKQLGSLTSLFLVSAVQLGELADARTREALATVLKEGIVKNEAIMNGGGGGGDDEEEASPDRKLQADVAALVQSLEAGDAEANTNADMAANVLTSILLRSSPESGLDPREIEHRRKEFGTNAVGEKKMDSFLHLCWEAVQDYVLIMLIVLGLLITVVEVSAHIGECTTCWIEGTAILLTVIGVVLITAGIDYGKQFAFRRLTRSLHNTNTKQVIRDAKLVPVTDDDVVVGDILSVNAHSLASIPADCVLLGPLGDLHMNESSLTGESKLIRKRPGDVILSGTEAVQGSGKMVVIAVGVNSVAGKIKARVYDSSDAEKMDGEDENSPLYQKLDVIAKRIGMLGLIAASTSLIASCIIGFGFNDEKAGVLLKYVVTAITVLAVAVPEGLPLAVTLALAFSSNKMMKEQNLVKQLDACETMGSATTICTDKTGALLLSSSLSWSFKLSLLLIFVVTPHFQGP
jgi:P-type Ca2+ transporter type 2B